MYLIFIFCIYILYLIFKCSFLYVPQISGELPQLCCTLSLMDHTLHKHLDVIVISAARGIRVKRTYERNNFHANPWNVHSHTQKSTPAYML